MTTQARPRIALNLSDVSLAQAIDAISVQAKSRISYIEQVVSKAPRVSARIGDATIEEALAHVLKGTGFSYQKYGAGYVIVSERVSNASRHADGTVSGRVMHAKTKQPVSGATITADGSSASVTTSNDGSFRLILPAGEHTITVKAIGLMRQRRTVTVTESGSTTVDVMLEPSASVLDEVVVTGSVIATERKAIPTPITVITAEEIERRGITRIEQLLRGSVPGVLALERGSQTYNATLGAMATSSVYARGASGVVGEENPLKTYVDGVEIADPAYLGTIDPSSIDRIEVIVGPQAATVYGSGAMGGVMQIFTKQGAGRTNPEVALNVRYGILENNVAPGKTPSHNDLLSVSGGSGNQFTYAGTLSYNYTGQWRPGLFNRRVGGSVGSTLTQGDLLVSGSASLTSGGNGTNSMGVSDLQRIESGEWIGSQYGTTQTQKRSTTSSQTFSLQGDYRPFPFWQHHLTVGRSQTDLQLIPLAPQWYAPEDSLFSASSSTTRRITAGYNTTGIYTGSIVSSNMTVGITGAWGEAAGVQGCLVSSSATSYSACMYGQVPTVTRSVDDRSMGAFGNWQVGVWNRLFFTTAIRGEKNPAYGVDHNIDWTPTYGATYTVEYGDVTVKLLTSYGRATRAPAPELRLDAIAIDPRSEPSQWLARWANPDLRPEYSRGTQGGVEVYWANYGSLTINHYQQRVTDLIQGVFRDTIVRRYVDSGVEITTYPLQFINIAQVRQRGWDATLSGNIGPVTVQSTYSWSDSRATVASDEVYGSVPELGASFTGIPTRSGNITVGYARGVTSVTLVTNWIGNTLVDGYSGKNYKANVMDVSRSRIKTYMLRAKSQAVQMVQSGYAKTDLVLSQQLKAWITATLNVTNLANSYGSEGRSVVWPTLGRQTLLGVTLKFPRR